MKACNPESVGDMKDSNTLIRSVIRGFLFFLVAFGAVSLLVWLFQPGSRHGAPIALSESNTTLLVEGSKEFDSIIIMLNTLTTGLFLIVALVARNPLRPSARATAGQMVLLAVFALSAAGSFYSGLQAKYVLSDGILAKTLELSLIGRELGMQAWFVASAGAAAISLIVDALLTVKP